MTKTFSLDDQLKKAKKFINGGNFNEAKLCYEKILSKFPKNARAIEGLNKINTTFLKTDNSLNSSITQLIELYNKQSYEKCILYGKELCKQYPYQSIIPNIVGATYAALGDYQNSINEYKIALKIEPNNAQVFNNLGITFKKLGDHQKAIESFKKSIKIKNDFAEAYNNLALSLKEDNKLQDAISNLKKAISIKADYTEAFYNLGNTLTALGEFNEAIQMFKKAIKLNPSYFDALNNMGATYNLLKDYRKAHESISEAMKISPNVADAHNNLGTAELNLDNEDRAIQSYKNAIEIDPKYVMAYSNLCSLYERSNNLNKFQKVLLKADREGLSHNEEIKFRKGQLYSRNKDFQNSIVFLEQVNDSKISNKMKIEKYELLGKDYDKSKNYQLAFNCFKKSNLIVKSSLETKLFHPEKYLNEVEQLIQSYSKFKDKKWDETTENTEITPIFLIGFPRSGTTLLDNILSSHTNIFSLEEKPMIANVKKALNKIATFENLNELNKINIEKLRSAYIDELLKYTSIKNLNGKIFIDKLPLSIIDIGLILRIFPRARFILAIRHPLDCILSCFMQTFNLNDAMANFLDLKNAAQLYNRSMKLFDIYNSNFKLNYHLIKYENLIESIKNETSELLKFLGLEWEKEIDNYRNNALAKKINTPSYNQVTEKIYKRASGRWKNYKNEIEDIIPDVEFWIEKWGY